MKKYMLLVFSVLLVIIGYSINTKIVQEKYVGFIKAYNSDTKENHLINKFKDEMKNLGLYRYYRNNMVGSAEFVDRPTDIQTYLSMIHKSMTFNSDEEKLAFAGFLCYVQTDLAGGELSNEVIKSMPAYFVTVQDIYQNMQNEALLYIGNVIAYSMGLVETSPYTNIEKHKTNSKLENLDLYTYSGEKNELYDGIIKKNSVKLNTEIEKLANSGITGEDLEYEIDNLSSELLEDITKKNDEDLNSSVAMFIKEAKKGINLSYLRFIIYLAVILVGVKFFKKYLNYIILGVFGYEVFYLIFMYNFSKDIITSFFYGSFIVVAVAIMFFVKFFSAFGRDVKFVKRLINVSLFILLALLLFIPTYYSKDLTMKNTKSFHNSSFENQLLKDVLLYNHSVIHKNLTELTNSITTENSEAKNIYSNLLKKYINDSIENNIIESISNDYGVNIKNNINGLLLNKEKNYTKVSKDYAEAIDKFVKASELRMKNINNEIKTMKLNIERIEDYSDEQFLKLFKNNLDSYFMKNKLLVPVKKDIDESYTNFNAKDKLNIKAYNTDYGTKMLMIFFLGIVFWIVFEGKLIKWSSFGAMIISSVLMFIKPGTIEVLSQIKYPVLKSSEFSVNILYGIIMVLITILLTIKKGGSES
ncbi:hypothetical protein OSSY52_11390 [Tepiditoga spiralis]|uniref:Uncharacterized protein n=1 Tax=Tepiditoga spiralis TaxID=2108365 RepID=A0A7G1G3J1_9BACT|nr:hypothetical protein [Tepiditoga spiralis]BBE30998.1 hypothetical protein OSSY52_11390 [Tepiditoga spiralis]